jgi:hypothetical protein
MKRYEIHTETQDIPNMLTGKLVERIDRYHVVVVGAEPDDMGDLHAVCGAVVDREPWKRPLRDWLQLADKERCPACDKTAGKDLEAVTDPIDSPVREQP